VEVPHWWPEVSWCQEVLWQILFRCNQTYNALVASLEVVQSFTTKIVIFKAVEVLRWWPEISWCQRNQKHIIFQCNQSFYILIVLYWVTAYRNIVGHYSFQWLVFKAIVNFNPQLGDLWIWLLKSFGAKEIQWQIIFQCNQSRCVLIDLYWNFIPNTVVLKLWKFLIDDLKSLGAKKFYGKLSSSAISHVMYWLIYIVWQLIEIL